MITLKETMLKMSVSGLSKIINPTVMDIIYEFDASPNLSNLINIVLEVYTEQGLLSDKNKLINILEHLPESEANNLSNHLNITINKSEPWAYIYNLKISRVPDVLKFFGISYSSTNKSDSDYAEALEVIRPKYALFPHQEVAIREIQKFLTRESLGARVLLHMPTGAGKTRTSMNVVSDFFRETAELREDKVVIWLADTEELCEQAAEEFEKAWKSLGVGDVSLYRFYGNYEHELTNISSGFVVAGLHKLNARLGKDQSGTLKLGSKLRLIVFDEAHKILAPTYQHIVQLFQSVSNPGLLGLSATPGRATFDQAKNQEFADFFNRNKVELKIKGYDNPVDYLQDSGYLAKVNYIDLPYKPEDLVLTENDIKAISEREVIPERILKALGDDTKRNIKIIEVALREVENGSHIILFACSVQNAEGIYALLAYKGLKVGIVTSDTPKDLRRQVIDQYRSGELSIIVNYGVLTTGFDAPITNVAIIGRPTTSLTLYSQMVGRASRGEKAGGNKECTVYTVTDDLPGFRNMADAFKYWDDAWN